MLARYKGREDDLLKNLKKLKAKQEGELSNVAKITSLVGELSLPKSANKMLAKCKGQEEELLKNLKKMKSKQDDKVLLEPK